MSWEEKFDWDVRYVDDVRFLRDWGIVFKTVRTVFLREGISSGTSETMEEFTGNSESDSDTVIRDE